MAWGEGISACQFHVTGISRSLTSTSQGKRAAKPAFRKRIFANTVVRWDQLCAAILSTPDAPVWRNGRAGFSFLVYTISKNAIESRSRLYLPLFYEIAS